MQINTEISLEDNRWLKYPLLSVDYISNIAILTLSYDKTFSKIYNFELSILLTDSERIAKLNNEFRGKDSATNVLSFPNDEDTFLNMSDEIYLGDIAFCFEIIEQEAIAKNISFYDHFAHLLVHGILHLIGHDHETEIEADAMENLETQILLELNISNPYA